MLFMQPWLSAVALNAFNTTSTTRCEVNTLPPTTAAFSEGLRMVPEGIITLIGFKQPYNRN